MKTGTDPREMFASIRANYETLHNCPRHFFNLHAPPYMIGEKIKCENCGGEMSLTSLSEYCRGYMAAGKPAEDVCPQWNK